MLWMSFLSGLQGHSNLRFHETYFSNSSLVPPRTAVQVLVQEKSLFVMFWGAALHGCSRLHRRVISMLLGCLPAELLVP